MARGSKKPTEAIKDPEKVSRIVKAIEMRKAGVSYAQIAQACGWKGPQGAHKAVTKALRLAVVDKATELLKVEMSRLDDIQLAFWRRAREGDERAAMMVLQVIDRRAALMGLGKRTVELTGPDGGPARAAVIMLPPEELDEKVGAASAPKPLEGQGG